jgi:NAD(P)-dependent dehydrogenase (short-subunit alcohol dehydrogenase family)
VSGSSRRALVTGGQAGAGFEVAKLLVDRGMRVIVAAKGGSDLERALEALGSDRVEGCRADWRTRGELEAFAAAVGDPIEVFVHAEHAADDGQRAGESVLATDSNTLQASFEATVLAALGWCRALVPRMRAQRYGRIVLVSNARGLSDDGEGDPRGLSVDLGASGIRALTRALGRELAGDGIKVNAVCPSVDPSRSQASDALLHTADTAVWLATLRDDGPSGGLFRDCKAVPW